MQNPRLASRYAKSLIDLAIEKGQLEQVFADMQWLQAACKSSRDFVNLLRSPIIKGDAKHKILTAVTGGKIGELTAAFNALLIAKGREGKLPEIITAFIEAYKKHKNIQTVKLTTATAVSDSLKNEIVAQIKKTGGFENVELEQKVDESLIGGFVLQVGDKLVDASISYDLKHIARQFENNDFVYKVR
ncbi:MAG: synthase subunit delta [Bacteroidota bacterium]|jgi:F-type H+-transporting ATPase subunit delta